MTSLGIPNIDVHLKEPYNTNDKIENIIEKYSRHPSILRINEAVTKGDFSFDLVDFQDIKAEILKLKTNASN